MNLSSSFPITFEPKEESGSVLPLMIGFFLILLTLYMVIVDIYVMRETQIALDRKGELLLRSAFREVAYDKYYFEEISIPSNLEHHNSFLNSTNRVFVPFNCSDLLTNIALSSSTVDNTFSIIRSDCESNQLTLVLGEQVKLPFVLPIFNEFKPQVLSFTRGGVQRISTG